MSQPQIECPEDARDHNVVPSGVDGLGHFCAHGFVGDRVAGRTLLTATKVWAKVFVDFDATHPDNQSHDAHTDATPIDVDGEGLWRSEAIPGARHGQLGGTLSNILVVWADAPGSGPEPFSTRPFNGLTADEVSCCPGSGSGGDGRAVGQKGAAPPAGVVLATAPLVWSVVAAGFEGASRAFNGVWRLSLRPAVARECAWDNGEPGHAVPHVELRCETPVATTWRLTFRDGSGRVVEYTREAAGWNALAANVVRRCGAAAGGEPDALTITPG